MEEEPMSASRDKREWHIRAPITVVFGAIGGESSAENSSLPLGINLLGGCCDLRPEHSCVET